MAELAELHVVVSRSLDLVHQRKILAMFHTYLANFIIALDCGWFAGEPAVSFCFLDFWILLL